MDDLIQSMREAACNTTDEDVAYLLRHAAALEAAREDAARWHELCRQVEDGELPGGILEDAKHLGAGALEMHIDYAREARNG